MKPKVWLEPNEFLQILEQSNSKVIKTGKILFQGIMYVTEGSDYYFYTYAKEQLQLPEGTNVIHAKTFQF